MERVERRVFDPKYLRTVKISGNVDFSWALS